MANNGYIKLYRQILKNPVVCKDSDHFSIWVYLLLNATHDNLDAIFNGERITLQPGQLITGRKSISSELNINESKVRRVLNLFENDQQISRQRSNKNSLITILKWSLYQGSDQQNEQQSTNNRPTSDQQVTTNKNVKNDNNVKNDKNNNLNKKDSVRFVKPNIDEIRDYINEQNLSIDPNVFYDYYESNGWVVGKNKMKDWKATIRNWDRKNNQSKSNQSKSGSRMLDKLREMENE